MRCKHCLEEVELSHCGTDGLWYYRHANYDRYLHDETDGSYPYYTFTHKAMQAETEVYRG